ncbi:exported hypothetical protein [Candidatus Sulfotelmatobacter kueseliae]|uniref:Uncharacterized protein n=1 Tax=Candidatus Sulfotelmatobacter kueseliae TaxID=2042962 RepID=A0A2U3KRU1_9BACT|nr:exported hypothetical protein [Candidatus Sulfotelmatobacter kueseliae]
MYKRLFLSLCLCVIGMTSVLAKAQEQHPEIFGQPSVVTMGAEHIETLWTEASGKWSDAGKDMGTTSSHVECYKKFGFCTEAEAYSLGGQAWVNVTTLDILRWDSQELIAVDSSPTCQVNQIRFDFKTKQVSVTESPKGETKDPFCKDVKPTTAYLGGLKDELRRLDKERTRQK